MTVWTPEKVEMLIKLWARGLSASQVAKEIGDVTRNAVIGKIHRIGLAEREKTKTNMQQQKTTRKPSKPSLSRTFRTIGSAALKTHAENATEMDIVPVIMPKTAQILEIQEEKCDLMQLSEKTCRWPIGSPNDEDFGFCGKPSKDGAPYCEHHCSIAYQPLERKKQRNS